MSDVDEILELLKPAGWDGIEPQEDEQHQGHFSRLAGNWYCDTCDSPYCDLA